MRFSEHCTIFQTRIFKVIAGSLVALSFSSCIGKIVSDLDGKQLTIATDTSNSKPREQQTLELRNQSGEVVRGIRVSEFKSAQVTARRFEPSTLTLKTADHTFEIQIPKDSVKEEEIIVPAAQSGQRYDVRITTEEIVLSTGTPFLQDNTTTELDGPSTTVTSRVRVDRVATRVHIEFIYSFNLPPTTKTFTEYVKLSVDGPETDKTITLEPRVDTN